MNRGLLLAFEGIDGSGKSTQARRLAARLVAGGVDVVSTGEPTDGAIGRRIREMLRSGTAVAPELELAWFCDDRREHVAEVIRPALEAGRVVITDRYYFSTLAYQGARGLDAQAIRAQSEAEFPIPDLVLLLEVEARAGLDRTRARGGPLQPNFEREDFLERVAAQFAALEGEVIQRIDGAAEPDSVAESIAACVAARLGIP